MDTLLKFMLRHCDFKDLKNCLNMQHFIEEEEERIRKEYENKLKKEDKE